jgi:O-antigen/teichoic acid export membrane protein
LKEANLTLARSAYSGISWSAFSTLSKGILQLAQLIIVARFLGPFELGVLALLNIVVGVAQIFGEAGISNAVIYHNSLNKTQLNQLYLINILFGGVVSVFFFFLSYPLAAFFAIEQWESLFMYLAPIFLIRSFSQQPLALLQQRLAFDRIAKIEVFAAVMAFITLLILLYYNFRLTAVVIAQLLNALVLTIVVFMLDSSVRPRLTKIKWQSIAEPIRYGLYQSGERLVNYLGAQFDQLVIGKLLGSETLGIYAYIKALVFRPALQLINPIVNKVSFPLMVKYRDSHSMSDIYAQIIRVLGLINVPLYLLMASYPDTILLIIFGHDWQIHADLMRWLALYMLLLSFINPVGVLLKASGEVKRSFWWNIAVTVIRPLVIILGISHGIVFFIKMLVYTQVFLFFLHWYYLIKPIIPLTLIQLLLKIIIPCAAFGLASIITLFGINNLWELTDFYKLILSAIIYVLLILPFLGRIIKPNFNDK